MDLVNIQNGGEIQDGGFSIFISFLTSMDLVAKKNISPAAEM
jgi:hypothetical protein